MWRTWHDEDTDDWRIVAGAMAKRNLRWGHGRAEI